MEFSFAAFVTGAVPDGARAAFALGDGRVVWETGESVAAHDGAILRAAPHPSGKGVVTGGDDGRVVWSQPGSSTELAAAKGGWIDALATSSESGLIAFVSGRRVTVLSAADPAFERRFDHPASVADLAFDPKGRRLAAATYGGVALWYARIADQKPVMLRWAGSHTRALFSPDGRFVVSAMGEPALHVWRVADGRDGRMAGGYDAKVRDLVFAQGGDWLATSGTEKAILWPFMGRDGPLGKEPLELMLEAEGVVVRVAAREDDLVVGLVDGRVAWMDLDTDAQAVVKPAKGAPISALATMADGRIAWGDEAGGAGVLARPAP
jgi:WD40 repeat protein